MITKIGTDDPLTWVLGLTFIVKAKEPESLECTRHLWVSDLFDIKATYLTHSESTWNVINYRIISLYAGYRKHLIIRTSKYGGNQLRLPYINIHVFILLNLMTEGILLSSYNPYRNMALLKHNHLQFFGSSQSGVNGHLCKDMQ